MVPCMDVASFTLRGRHVTLESLVPEHAPLLLAAADASRSTYAFTTVPSDLTGMRAYIETALAELSRGESIPFAVRDANGTIAGSTRFMRIERWIWPGHPAEPVPNGPDAVEIGFTWYAERVQRTALNTEAKLLLCSHAFERWKVRRVTWRTHEHNERSRRAIERLGARFEGILRASGPAADGSVRNTAHYSMLSEEWPAARRKLVGELERRTPGVHVGG